MCSHVSDFWGTLSSQKRQKKEEKEDLSTDRQRERENKEFLGPLANRKARENALFSVIHTYIHTHI